MSYKQARTNDRSGLQRYLQSVSVHPPLRWTTSELWCLSGGKREDYQNCSVLYCVLKLCTVISTLRRAVLTVLWIEFCPTESISLCVDLFVFICAYFVCFCFVLHSCCITVSPWWDWSLILRTYFPSVLWHCWLGHLTRKNPSLTLTYNVFGGTVNLALSICECAFIAGNVSSLFLTQWASFMAHTSCSISNVLLIFVCNINWL